MSAFHEAGQDTRSPRDFKVMALELAEFIIGVVLVAALFRIFLFQSFSISGTVMDNTLLPGDRIFVNKFIYGPLVPCTGHRAFTIKNPSPGDVVAFRSLDDNSRFSVLRCVAGPGDMVEIAKKKCRINGAEYLFPASALAGDEFQIDARYSPRDNLEKVAVPAKDDVVRTDSLSLYGFDCLVSLIRQENPDVRVSTTTDLLVNGAVCDNLMLAELMASYRRTNASLNFDTMTWIELRNVRNFLVARNDSSSYRFRRALYMDGHPVREYTVTSDCYFLISDNWDQGPDSRYFGPISGRRILGRVSCVYWSADTNAIHWKRVLRFI